MDDDQAFVNDLIEFVRNHDSVRDENIDVDSRDEGRDATLAFELYAGDRYVITISEQHV